MPQAQATVEPAVPLAVRGKVAPTVLLEGAGAALILISPYILGRLSPYHLDLYHKLLPVTSVFRGLLIDLLVAVLLFAGLFALLERRTAPRPWPIWSFIGAILLWRAAVDVLLAREDLGKWYAIPLERYVPLALLATGLFLWWREKPKYPVLVRGIRLGLALIGCCIFWIVPQLLYCAFRQQPHESASFYHPATASARQGKNRIVWILLDELSYDQSFEHVQPDIALPNLHKLREQAVSFSDLRPAGFHTDKILPSLLIGQPVDGIKSSFQGDLIIRFGGSSQWRTFDPRATIFAEAQRDGWTTGVAGWYNPYCRLLAPVLNSCYWSFRSNESMDLSGRYSAWKNALAPLSFLESRLFTSKRGSLGDLQRTNHARDLNNVLEHAEALVRDQSVRFAFVHLPVPHPLGIFDRRTHHTQAGGTYLDNLVLADETLGDLLGALQQTSSDARTTVIISSDHSWRTPIWRTQAEWTPEEEKASGGRFDNRPVLMIRFPGQTSPETIGAPVPEIRLHGMIAEMLRGNMDSPDQLNAWLASSAGN